MTQEAFTGCRVAMRLVAAVLAFASALWSPPGLAQQWSTRSGVLAQIDYSDNYFLSADNQQSAFTGSIEPFVTAIRQTETSDLAALLAVGANKVWGQVSTSDYWSGRFQLDGSLREARSKWSGDIAFVRTPAFQSVADNGQTRLALAYTSAAVMSGTYSYQISEQWSLETTASAYDNRYSSVSGNTPFEDNHGYTANAIAKYSLSDRTQISATADYLHSVSGVSTDDVITGRMRVVYQVSPQLTTWASVGAFRINNRTHGDAVVPASNRPPRSDTLFEGAIAYDLNERSNLRLAYSQQVLPSGTGLANTEDSAVFSLLHRYSDRLTGRLRAGYSNADSNKYYRTEVGVSYALAERWSLEVSYRYARARYPGSPEAQSNGAFVSVAYNLPGASYTQRPGRFPDTTGAVGTGQLLPPGGQQRVPSSPSNDSSDQPRFEPFTLP